ncbi:MAG: hypothetical protein ACI3V1_07465, partial [Faecousia sp.]
MSCLMTGLLMLYASGFSVPTSLWFYPAVFLLCVGVTALFRNPWCRQHRLAIGTAVLLVYLLLLFLCQDTFFGGMRQFGDLAADTLSRAYHAEQAAQASAAGGSAAEIFLILAAVPTTAWFGASLFQKNSLPMSCLLLFPLLVLPVLCGAAKNTAALFLVLLGAVLCMAFARPKRQYRMWGGG